MKAIWKGSIGFGLVNIPINVYPASEEHTLEFHMLHKKDLSPIRFARICREENEEVPYNEIVKGYEYEKGEYVVLQEKDFKAANAKKTSTIDVQYFTDLMQIDPIYYEKPYFLEPDKKSGKAFKLLWEALGKSKKVAIANFVFRNKEHIGVILPMEETLLLIQMRYYGEIRPYDQLLQPQEKTSAQELKIAMTLIDQLTQPFEPEKHHDSYLKELMELIQQKVEGRQKPSKKRALKETHPGARDLMYLLQESMKKAAQDRGGEKIKHRGQKPAQSKKRSRST